MKAFIYLREKDAKTGMGFLTIDNVIRTAIEANGNFHAENKMGSRWNIPKETIHMIEMVE